MPERSEVAIKPEAKIMNGRAHFAQRRRPCSVSAEIADGHFHPRGTLMPDELREMIFGAAAIDRGHQVQDSKGRRHAGISSVCRRSDGASGEGCGSSFATA